jgi:hypothetical protein
MITIFNGWKFKYYGKEAGVNMWVDVSQDKN